MKLKDDPGKTEVVELKKEVSSLRKELDELYAEHNRLQILMAQSNHTIEATPRLSTEVFLKDNLDVYRLIVEAANEGIWMSDTKADTIFVNKRITEMLGYSEEEMIGRSAYDFLDDEGKAIAKNNLQKRLSGEKDKYEMKYIRKDGSPLWAILSVSPFYDAGGKVTGVLGLLTDITERKLMEDALIKSEQRYKQLVESASSIIIRIKKDGTITFINEYALEFLGYKPEELLGKNVMIIVPKVEVTGRDLSNLFEEIVSNPKEYLQFENQNLKKDGTLVWVNWSNRILRDENGKVVEVLTIGNDVSHIKAIEEEFRTRSTEVEAILGCIADGVIVYNKQGQIIRLNSAAERLLNIRPEEKDLTLKDRFERHYKVWNEDGRELGYNEIPAYRSAVDRETVKTELFRYEIDGETKWISISAAPLIVNGNHIGCVVSMSDMSWRKQSEENLRKKEELFSGIFDNIPVMITIYDPELQNFRFNKELKKLTGWTEDDAADGRFVEKVYPNPVYRQGVIDFMKTLKPGWKEWVMTTKDGRELESSWANILLNSGIQIGIGIDIRERKKAEAELKESEQRLRATFNNAAVGIVEVDHNGRFIAANDRIREILGYSNEEFIGKTVSDITYPEDRFLSNFVNNKIHAGDVNMFNYEKRYVKKDGTPIWVHVTVSGVYDTEGNHVNSIATIENISDRREVEDALRLSEERFRMLADNMSQMVWILDKGGTPIWFNKRWFDYTGVSLEDMQNEGHKKVNHPDHVEKVINGLHGCISCGTPWEETYPMLGKNGEYRWFLSRAVPIVDNKNETTLWFGTSTDITAQKQAEEEARIRATEIEAILSCIPDGVLVYDTNGHIIRSNESANMFLKYEELESETDIQQRISKFYEFWDEEGRRLSEIETPAYKAAVMGEVIHNKILYIKSQNYSKWVIFNGAPLIVSGKHAGGVLSMLDITRRKQMEEKLRNSEQRLEAIFNNAAIGIVELDANNKFIMVNDKTCEILGYSRDELLEKTVMEITTPEDRENTRFLYELLFKGEVNILNYEKKYLKKDGSDLWVHVSVSAIRGKKGKLLRSIGTIKDISERKSNEQQLKQAFKIAEEGKNILTALMEYLPMGISIADAPDVNIRLVSKYGQDVLGRTEEMYRDIPALEHPFKWGIFHNDGQTPATTDELPLTRVTLKGEIIKGEEWFVSRIDGTLLPILVNGAPILDKEGNIIGGVIGWQDIAERRKILEDLKKSEEQLRTVIDAADLGTWEFDIETGIASHSLRHDQIFGYEEPQNEWSYEISVKHIFPEYHQTVRDAVARAIETGILYYDAKILWPDGSIRWIGPRGRVFYDYQGKPLRMAGIVSDITERKEAEIIVKESEEKFRSLFENITEGVALHEIEYDNNVPVRYHILDANPAYKEYMGYDSQTNISTLENEIFRNDQLKYFREYSQVAETRQPFKFEAEFPSMNKYFVINVISPKKGQFATVLEDITEQKRIENELKQKNDELTRFIYTVSHDLKSPLVTIKSFSSYLEEDIKNDDKISLAKDIHYIKNAADRMGNLLDELLELSRIGRKEPPKTEIPLDVLAQSALDLVAGRIAQKNIKVNFTGPKVMLYGHYPRLIQLYQNLLDNAAKFMGDQPDPLIEIGAFKDHDRRNEIVMFVRDNGTGIDPKYHHKVFGLFEKLDNSTEGTGIGLALIKRIIEVHDGSIWFTSEGQGKGTTFYFTLAKSKIIS